MEAQLADALRYTYSISAGMTPPPNECPKFDTKWSYNEAQVMEFWGMWSNPSLPLLLVPLWTGVVVHVRFLSRIKTWLFNHLLYLQPFNCVQTNDWWIELLILLKIIYLCAGELLAFDSIPWNHVTVLE